MALSYVGEIRGRNLSLDPITYAGKADESLLCALVEMGYPLRVEAPLSLAEAGKVDAALYLVREAQRLDDEEWQSLTDTAKERSARRKADAMHLKSGKFSSYKTEEQYLTEAKHLAELARRLG